MQGIAARQGAVKGPWDWDQHAADQHNEVRRNNRIITAGTVVAVAGVVSGLSGLTGRLNDGPSRAATVFGLGGLVAIVAGLATIGVTWNVDHHIQTSDSYGEPAFMWCKQEPCYGQ
jgi:hypothetical protein